MPAWNTRTSFRRTISSSARNVTIRSPPRVRRRRRGPRSRRLRLRRAAPGAVRCAPRSTSRPAAAARRARLERVEHAAERRQQAEEIDLELRSRTPRRQSPRRGRRDASTARCAASRVRAAGSAAALKRWYSSSRCTSASRGSSSGVFLIGSGRGRSIRLLMWMSVAAMTRNSPATSRFSSSISVEVHEVLLRDDRNRDVVDVHLVLLDEVQQQIERPVETSSLTGYASGYDSKFESSAGACIG